MRTIRYFTLTFAFFLCFEIIAEPPKIVVAYTTGLEKFHPLIAAVYKRIGLSCVFEAMPSERGLISLNEGRVDAEIGRVAGLNKEYTNIVYTKEAIVVTKLLAWTTKRSGLTKVSTKDLARLRIGIVIGHRSAETLLREQGISPTRNSSLKNLASMLELERIDLVIVPESIDQKLLDSAGKQVTMESRNFPAFHLFAKKNAALADQWDRALRQMKADGSYAALMK